MARKKLSPLVQAMTLFNQMDERDKVTLADYIKSQTLTPRKAAAKKTGKVKPTLLPDNPEDFHNGATA